jgi:hypothetical protein
MSLKSGTIPKKKDDVLNKIIPKNKKYENVRPVVNVGYTAKKREQERDEDPDHSTKGEIFKRIKLGIMLF